MAGAVTRTGFLATVRQMGQLGGGGCACMCMCMCMGGRLVADVAASIMSWLLWRPLLRAVGAREYGYE